MNIKNRIQTANRTYLQKLFAVYCAIIIFFVIILSVIFMYGYNKINRTEFESENKIAFLNEYRQLETVFNTALNATYLMAEEQAVYDYAGNGLLEKQEQNFYVISTLRKLISDRNALFTFSNISLSVSNITDNIIIHGNKTEDINIFLKNYGTSKTTVISDFSDKELSGSYFSVYSDVKNNKFLIANKHIFKNGLSTYLFASVDLTDIFEKDTENTFALVNNETVMNCSKNDTDIDISTLRTLNKNLLNESSGSFVYRGVRILYSKSESLDKLTYILLLKNKFSLCNIFLLYAIMLIAAAVFLSFVIAKNMYKPIGSIVKIFSSYFGNDVTDELEFIRTSSENMLTSYQLSSKKQFIFDLLCGWHNPDTLSENLVKYKMTQILCGCVCFVIEYSDTDCTDRFSVKTGFDYIRERISEEIHAECYDFGLYKSCCITYETDIQKLKSLLFDILNDTNISGFRIAIGEKCSSPAGISASYIDALSALECMPKTESLIVASEISFVSKESFIYPLEIEKNLIECTVSGFREKTNVILKGLIDKNITVQNDRQHWFEFKFSIVSTIKRILNRIGKPQEEVFGSGTIVYLEITSAESADELTHIIYNMFGKILDITEQPHRNEGHPIINDIKKYIAENYSRDISLSDVAESVNLTANYVGKIIKSETGENFKDYINKIRIDKAKEILAENPGIKLETLSGMIGFNSSGTLIRIFKKYEGISPKQYHS